MQNENYSYEDLNSWFTHPGVETSQPFDRFSTDSILPELEGFGVPGPSEFYYGTFSGMASDGSWGSFDSSPGATAFNANYSQLLPSSGTHSPPRSMISSLPPTARSTLLEQRSSYGGDSALPPSLTLPTMSYQQDGLIHYRATPTFSTSNWMFDNELVSSPIPIARDLPPVAEHATLHPHIAHSLSASPIFVKSHAAPQITSGRVDSDAHRLPQRKYSSRSQSGDFSPAAISYGGGYRLDKIRDGVAGIVDQQAVAFPGKRFAQKASFRLEMEGYEPFTLQLNVNTTSGPPTRLRFALRTVDFVERFIKQCREQGKPFPYKLDELLLMRIELVSEASVQPVFDIVQAA